MRLSDFLRANSGQILAAWDEFAATVVHDGKTMDQKALRDHAGQILRAIADDLDAPQSAAQLIAKSRGEGGRDAGAGDTPAATQAPATRRPRRTPTRASSPASASTPCSP